MSGKHKGITRRQFLKGGAAALATVAASGLIVLNPSQSVRAATTRVFNLSIVRGTIVTVDGTQIFGLSYTDNGSFKFPAPPLFANEGDTVTVNLTNTDTVAHNFAIPGVATLPTVAAGGSGTVTFIAPAPGSRVYMDSLSIVNRELGLHGGFVTLPADGSSTLFTGGPAFDLQYLWVLSQTDTTWNSAAAAGNTVNTATFKPNYFFINGRSFPDTDKDPATLLKGQVGQTMAVRYVNGGLNLVSMHTHGYHFDLLIQDGAVLANPKLKDTATILPAGSMDTWVELDQPGLYAVHEHVLMGVTANGVYPKGMMAMFDVA